MIDLEDGRRCVLFNLRPACPFSRGARSGLSERWRATQLDPPLAAPNPSPTSGRRGAGCVHHKFTIFRHELIQ